MFFNARKYRSSIQFALRRIGAAESGVHMDMVKKKALLTELLQKTEQRQVMWGPGNNDHEFGITFGGGNSLWTGKISDPRGDVYTLFLKHKEGREQLVDIDDDSETKDLLHKVIDAARTSLKQPKIEKIIDSILDDLKKRA